MVGSVASVFEWLMCKKEKKKSQRDKESFKFGFNLHYN